MAQAGAKMTAVHGLSAEEARVFAEIPLFANLEPSEFDAIASTLKRQVFRRGETVYHRDDVPRCLFIIVKGQVKIRLATADGSRQVTFNWLNPGGFFGFLSLFSGQHNSDAVAVDDAEILFLDFEEFRAFLRRHPDEAERFMEMMAARWNESFQRFYDLAFLDVPGRLAKVLLSFANRQNHGESNGPVVLPGLTQRELASLTASTRESVNRWLLFFARQGCIEVHRSNITILKPEELKRRLVAEAPSRL